MRSRAALLPFPGDPFLLHYWLRYFDEVWSDEVDRLYVYLNSPVEKSVADYIISECEKRPKVQWIYRPVQIEHGEVINRLLDACTQDYVMLIEDDGFIFKKGVVDHYFSHLEIGNYDIVGSKRGSCAMEILTAAQRKWGLNYEGEGDQGCNFWPCYFFSSKQTLIQTDRLFGARAWHRGEIVAGLEYQIQDEVSNGDTFVNTSLQLQAKYPQSRILYVPQYHGSPEDLEHAMRGKYLFDGHAPWTHVGSLSSGIGGVLQDGHGRSLARIEMDPDLGPNTPLPNYCHSEQEKHEFERRVQWWLTFYEQRDQAAIPAFAALYFEAIRRLISQYELDISRIRLRQKTYRIQLGL